jgi:hypothetical protein
LKKRRHASSFFTHKQCINQVRIKGFDAFGAETMANCDIGMSADIDLKLIPIPLIVSNLLACRTDWQKAAKLLHFSLLRLVERFLRLNLVGDIDTTADIPGKISVTVIKGNTAIKDPLV